MAETFTYRFMNSAELLNVSELVTRVLNEVIASEYSSQRIQECYRYIQPDAFLVPQ